MPNQVMCALHRVIRYIKKLVGIHVEPVEVDYGYALYIVCKDTFILRQRIKENNPKMYVDVAIELGNEYYEMTFEQFAEAIDSYKTEKPQN